MVQDKAQIAQAMVIPLSRAATPYWAIIGPPFGRGEKPSSTALASLQREQPFTAKYAL